MGAKPKNRNLACQESAKARLISGTDALRETPYAWGITAISQKKSLCIERRLKLQEPQSQT